MSVLTTAYSIPVRIMRKIQREIELLANILHVENDWKVESYGFDSGWQETIKIIAESYPKTGNRLYPLNYWGFPEYEIWSVTPFNVKIVAEDLKSATFENLKDWGLKMNLTDYYGKPIPKSDYDYYVGDIKKLKKFLRKTAVDRNYLLFATG